MGSLQKRRHEKYADYPFKDKKPSLDAEQKQWLKEALKKDSTQSLPAACEMVKEDTGV